MAPFYRGYQNKIVLDSDDIIAVQALYGANDEEESDNIITDNTIDNTRDGKSLVNNKALCTNSTIDSIFTMQDGSTYVFKSENFWKLTDESVAPGYPRKISKDWRGLPSRVDASFTWKNGKSYFFSGSKYWRFTGNQSDPGERNHDMK